MAIKDNVSSEKEKSDSWGSEIDKARSEAITPSAPTGESETKPKRKYTKRTLKGASQKSNEMGEEIAKLLSPENLKPILRAPADLMLLKTGRDLWKIPDEELDPLCYNASMTAKYFVSVDPKWLSLIFFSYSLCLTYGARMVENTKANAKDNPKKESKENE